MKYLHLAGIYMLTLITFTLCGLCFSLGYQYLKIECPSKLGDK